VVLHGRIEYFLYYRAHAVDFVDEQHVAFFQAGEYGGQVAGLFQHRPRGGLERHAHFIGDDVRQRGLAEPWRAENQDVVERFAAPARGGDENVQLRLDRILPDIVGQARGPDGTVVPQFGG